MACKWVLAGSNLDVLETDPVLGGSGGLSKWVNKGDT